MYTEKTISKPDGLKTADCAIIAQVAGRFSCDIFLIKGNKKVNAKSIMGLISLNIKVGDLVFVSTSGNDESLANERILSLL
ncbi:MAG: HPr family phosphocarrier protein [Christensenellaceae bacterium]|jgi:phosphotransferase system HPr (HPr) family protein|nr:HPr family phosphocarrier protein [Christensenellaceae bacterium]